MDVLPSGHSGAVAETLSLMNVELCLRKARGAGPSQGPPSSPRPLSPSALSPVPAHARSGGTALKVASGLSCAATCSQIHVSRLSSGVTIQGVRR